MIKDRLTSAGMLLLLPIAIFLATLLFTPNPAEAGIYSENSETIYQENWIPHSEFRGHCDEPGGKWFIEPWDCEMEMDFDLPNVNTINKIEIYVDLWRNHDDQSARFSINDGATIKPNVGSDWSRSPYIHEFTGAALNDFQTGTNTIKFWDEEGAYHVHDVAIRIYSNASNVATTMGSLHKIRVNGVDYDPYNSGNPGLSTGSNLTVNNDQILVSANVNGTADYVEFHAYYDGYDEDNDGDFTDWHNLNNNNWNEGASNNAPGLDNPTPALGGTINHIQTVEVGPAGVYSATWNIPHIISQSGVRFKVRIVDANDHVRDAAGGDSRSFNLVRNTPSAYFINPDFEDQVLHHNGDDGFPEEYSTTVILPDDITAFDSAYLIGAYYANLYVSINDGPQIRVFESPANSTGRWDLSIINSYQSGGQSIDIFDELMPGENTITYHYWNAGNQWGSFIEKPGPMIVLKREDSSLGADSTPPDLFNAVPADGDTFAEVDTNISFWLLDTGSGVNNGSITMEVNDNLVNPTISNGPSGTRVVYNPPTDFPNNTDVTVEVNACDNSSNCMSETYTFRTIAEDSGALITTDDFNACLLGDTDANWTFVDPEGDSTAVISEDYQTIEISVPEGNRHDPSDPITNTNTSARILQPANNAPNFVIETKFLTIPDDKFQIQGMLLQEDANDYMRYDMFFNQGVLKLYVSTFTDGTETVHKTQTVPNSTRYILINRISSVEWDIFYSADGNNWTRLVNFNHNMVVNNVGLYAGNAPSGGQTPAYTAVFDYILDWGAPFTDGEDSETLTLPVNVEGNGAVQKSVECGKPVTLTAVPELGWSFDSWSGAANSTDNPVVVTDWGEGESVTANFTRDEYTVSFDITSYDHTGAQTTDGAGGSIQADQATYYYGDTVTLTAVNTPGWSATDWSGAGLSGGGDSQTFTILGNETVDVRFDQDKYNLDITFDGPGNVNVSSAAQSRGYYIYGDQITLTAVETDPDFKFRKWSGDVNSFDNPYTFTVTGELNVTATFTDEILIFLPLINR
ncbi:MAG: hypothetical protein AAF490_00650 [Chloroflexota bacterium]